MYKTKLFPVRVVYIHGERTHQPLGAERWCVTYADLKQAARERLAREPEWEWDPYADTTTIRHAYATRAAARKVARKLVDSRELYFGTCEVVHQRVEWFVEEDGLAEWADVGESELFD